MNFPWVYSSKLVNHILDLEASQLVFEIELPTAAPEGKLIMRSAESIRKFGVSASGRAHRTLIFILKTLSFPGGMKAVLWTDLFQSILMFGSMFAVLIAGTYRLGGLSNVMHEVIEGGRLEFGRWVRTRHSQIYNMQRRHFTIEFSRKCSERWGNRPSPLAFV